LTITGYKSNFYLIEGMLICQRRGNVIRNGQQFRNSGISFRLKDCNFITEYEPYSAIERGNVKG
jgi:hypothetical protein